MDGVIERVAYRPLRNSSRLAVLISAIGMSLILQNYVQLSQGANQQGVPTMLTGALRFHVGDGFVQITYMKVFILIAAFAGMGILTYVIQKPNWVVCVVRRNKIEKWPQFWASTPIKLFLPCLLLVPQWQRWPVF